MKFCDGQSVPLLNPLEISENQKSRFSDVFKGYNRGKLA